MFTLNLKAVLMKKFIKTLMSESSHLQKDGVLKTNPELTV